jgi:hypothetical protein
MAFLNWKVGFDTTSFNAGLKRMRASFNGWAKDAARGIGGQIAGAMAFQSIVQGIGGELQKMADIERDAFARGISTDMFQRLAKAARLANTDVDTLIDSMDDISDKRFEALQGSEDYLNIFKRYGLEFDDIANTSNLSLFQSLAEGINALPGLTQERLLRDLDELASDAGKRLAYGIRQGYFSNLDFGSVPYTQEQITQGAQTRRDYVENMAEIKTMLMKGYNSAIFGAGEVLGGLVAHTSADAKAQREAIHQQQMLLKSGQMARSLEKIEKGFE